MHRRFLTFVALLATLAGGYVFAQSVIITDGNGGNNTTSMGVRRSQVVDDTVSGDVVGKRGVFGLTPAPTFTPTSTPTPTETPTPTPTP
jgi:hypothetical protein